MLKPTDVSSKRLPTASMVHLIFFTLQNLFLEFIRTKGNLGITLAKQLAITTKNRFEKCFRKDVYTYAMILDPQFKEVVLKDHEKLLFINN